MDHPDVEPSLDRATCRRPATQTLVRRLLTEVVEACAASEATFWVASADGERLEAAINCGPKHEVVESLDVPVSDSVVGMVALTNSAVCIGPGEEHNLTVDRAVGVTTQSMAATPVHVRSHFLGVLSTINPTDRPQFDARDLDLLQWKAYLLSLLLADQLD